MQITFENIKFKNLLSYGDTFTSLDIKNGIDLVVGVNGQGKSSLVESIFYSLFGKPFRKIKTGSLINRVQKKKLEVQLIFKVDEKRYKIIRGMKPNKFEIYIESEDEFILIEQRAATKDYQKYLEEEILLINDTIFRQLIVLSSNLPSSKPFMELSQQEKESLFQVITDTSIFNHLKTVIKNKLSDNKVQFKELEYKRDILSASLQSEQIMVEQAEQQNNDFKTHHKENIRITEENITTTEETIVKYTDALTKLKELKIKYDEIQGDASNILMDLNDKKDKNLLEIQKIQEKNMAKYQELISECTISENEIQETQRREQIIYDIKQDNQVLSSEKMDLDAKIKIIEGAEKSSIACTACNTTNYLTDICDGEVHNKSSYLERIKNIKEEINKNTALIKTAEIELRQYKTEVQEKIQLNKNNIKAKKDTLDTEVQHKQSAFDEELVPLQQQLQELRQKADNYKEKLLNGKRLKDTLQEQQKNLDYYNNKLNELNSIKLIEVDYTSLDNKKQDIDVLIGNVDTLGKNRDDLDYLETLINGNNLKGSVIKRQIPFLNKGINHFLELFSMLEYSFVIDENFKERLISRDIDSEFNQLSNGQKARISFSIMFAFLKLIEERNGVRTNLLVLDEILDSSVDASGREELLNILKSEFSETKNIVIISHNEQIKEKVELFDRMIHINKTKFSELKVEEL